MYSMKSSNSIMLIFLLVSVSFFPAGCDNGGGSGNDTPMKTYSLSPDAQGAMELVDNIYNMTIVSKDDNVLKAEYNAGFIQGKLQGGLIVSTRDNFWDIAYLTDPSHSFPKQIQPTADEISLALGVLKDNYSYTISYIENQQDPAIAQNLKRLVFRMLGIYHGTLLATPATLDFSDGWLPGLDYFQSSELTL